MALYQVSYLYLLPFRQESKGKAFTVLEETVKEGVRYEISQMVTGFLVFIVGVAAIETFLPRVVATVVLPAVGTTMRTADATRFVSVHRVTPASYSCYTTF